MHEEHLKQRLVHGMPAAVIIIIIFIIVEVEEGLNSDLSKSCSPETGSHESQVWRGVGYQQLAGKDLVKRPLRHELQTLSGYYPLGQTSNLYAAARSHFCVSLVFNAEKGWPGFPGSEVSL